MTDAPTTDETTAPEEPAEPPTMHGALMEENHGQTVLFHTRDQYLDLLKAPQAEGIPATLTGHVGANAISACQVGRPFVVDSVRYGG